MTAVRIFQIVIALNSLGLLIQSIRVIAVYSAVYTMTPDSHRKQLPLHVWLMALSYAIFAGTSTAFLMDADRANFFERIILYGTAGLLGQYALYQVLSYDRRKLSKVTNFREQDLPDERPGSPL